MSTNKDKHIEELVTLGAKTEEVTPIINEYYCLLAEAKQKEENLMKG